jgi:hypothetical protein
MRRIAMVAAALAAAVGALGAEPEYARVVSNEPARPVVEQILAEVPTLKHERGTRWPMILWECGDFAPQPPERYRQLLARGLTQHLQLNTNHIPAALALQAAGSPVILMQGAGGPWPAQLAGAAPNWAHRLDAEYKPQSYVKPCLSATEGWAIEADAVRAALRRFKEAGVTVDGVWMDWEGDPMSGIESFDQASHCSRCRATLPASVLASTNAFHAYRWRLYVDLLSTYLAAPVREVFPKCEVTNWMIVWSTPERPLRYWNDRVLQPTAPAFFTAANPVAYGNTLYWKAWDPQWPLDREGVDRLYFHLLIRMVSDSEANAARWAPWMKSFPWVSRWCPDDEDPAIPIMSRERYREVLRHLWLRGVDGMQVFNPTRKGFAKIVLSEVQDAVAVYDEMLEHRDILEGGEVLNLAVPGPRDDGVVWSGVRSGGRAVVRAFRQGEGKAPFTIEAWPGLPVELEAPAAGRTYLLTQEGGRARVR